MKKLVIFDLDGTLTYTLQDIMESLNKALTTFGYKTVTLEETRKYVGSGARKLVESALGDAKGKDFEKVLRTYNQIYNYCGGKKTVVYDGMIEVLQNLKKDGYLLAIISNKPQEGTDEVIKQFFGDKLFDFVLGGRENLKLKPSKECVEFCLENLKVKTEDALFIGDSDVDFLTSKNAQMDCICVLWGYRDKELLSSLGATNFANTSQELYIKIKQF